MPRLLFSPSFALSAFVPLEFWLLITSLCNHRLITFRHCRISLDRYDLWLMLRGYQSLSICGHHFAILSSRLEVRNVAVAPATSLYGLPLVARTIIGDAHAPNYQRGLAHPCHIMRILWHVGDLDTRFVFRSPEGEACNTEIVVLGATDPKTEAPEASWHDPCRWWESPKARRPTITGASGHAQWLSRN